MRMRSVYEVTCVCGHTFETESERPSCPHCGTQLELHWRGEAPKEAPHGR
jgi:hypothetical protein